MGILKCVARMAAPFLKARGVPLMLRSPSGNRSRILPRLNHRHLREVPEPGRHQGLQGRLSIVVPPNGARLDQISPWYREQPDCGISDKAISRVAPRDPNSSDGWVKSCKGL